MGGGKGNTGQVDPSVEQGELANQSALAKIAQQQNQNSQQLYSLTEPGLQTSEDFYQTLASGDPGAIMRAIAPTAQQAGEASAGAKANILQTAPAGGEKNLALDMTDVNKGAQISKAASGATLGAPNALAQLAGQGVGESVSAANTGISGLSASTQALGQLQSQEFQGQQLQMEAKGQEFGALGGLAGDAAQLGSSAIMAGAFA